MKKTYHKFLIIFTLLIVIGGVYSYFSNSLTSEAALSSSLGESQEGDLNYTSDNKIASDIAFISSLLSLTKLNIDTTLFMNKSFQSLRDNTVKLDLGVSGRVNPFAPVGTSFNQNNVADSLVSTKDPIDIQSDTVMLSGIVNKTIGVSNAYFEYGLTEELGTKTIPTTISLIGTFISNVTELNSATTYFYKACARVDGITLCGDIVSFKTN